MHFSYIGNRGFKPRYRIKARLHFGLLSFFMLFLLTACGGSGGGSGGGSAIVSTDNPAKPAQALSFNQEGTLSLLVGDTDAQPVSAQGTGAITYSSSDDTIATVDEQGVVSALASGSAVITADVAADATYDAASASYTVEIINNEVTLTGWVGSDDTQLSLPSGAEGAQFYRSSDPNCDLDNYAACNDGQLSLADGNPITDTAARLNQLGYYTLRACSQSPQQER